MYSEELPKAQKFFQEIVEKKVINYIQNSSKVADEYEKQKQQAQQNSLHYSASIQQLKRQIKILKSIEATKISFPGTTLEDVQSLIDNYQRVVDDFQSQRITNIENKDEQSQLEYEQEINIQIMNQGYSSRSEENSFVFSFQLSKDYSQENKKNGKKKMITYGLKSIEFMVVLVMVLAFIKIMFFV